jgi:hypothetical protein
MYCMFLKHRKEHSDARWYFLHGKCVHILGSKRNFEDWQHHLTWYDEVLEVLKT